MDLPLTIIEIYQYVEMDQSKNKKQNAIVYQNIMLIIEKLTINFFLVKVIIYVRLVDNNEKIVFVQINWISQVLSYQNQFLNIALIEIQKLALIMIVTLNAD
ncbi:unnamed protein product [Paramecium pentaurelia]|uniref:Uncharacterized protein n=1 Tax=Paramecium pentaurelia TaxID=43138 RepID=A0A8S1VSZ2_9CILI|nr:unnamed protein product [Paramecium pentaurelia]